MEGQALSETETGRLTPGIAAIVVCLIVFMGIVLPVTASMTTIIEGERVTTENPVGSERAVVLVDPIPFTIEITPDGMVSRDGGAPVHVDDWYFYTLHQQVAYDSEGGLRTIDSGLDDTPRNGYSGPLRIEYAGANSIYFYNYSSDSWHSIGSGFFPAMMPPVAGLGFEPNYGLASGDPAAVVGSSPVIHVDGTPFDIVDRYVCTMQIVTYAADGGTPGPSTDGDFAMTKQASGFPAEKKIDTRKLAAETSEVDGLTRVDAITYDGAPMQGWWVPLTWTVGGDPTTVSMLVGMVPVVLLAGLVAGVCGWAVARPRRSSPASSRSSPFSDGWRDAR